MDSMIPVRKYQASSAPPPVDVSREELFDVISAAASQDPSRVQASATRLKEMLDYMGTYEALYEIAAEQTIPLAVRQQSIIQFKNAALNHWRSRRLFTDDQRSRIRTRSMTLLDEPDETIAQCNQVIMSRLARQDYPSLWPNLLPDLMNIIKTNLQLRYVQQIQDVQVTLILRRSLKVLRAILKEFAKYKMLNGVKIMAQIMQNLHVVLYDYYGTISATFSAVTSIEEVVILPKTADDMFVAYHVYKCILTMAVWLWARSDKTGKEQFDLMESWFMELFKSSAIQLQTLVQTRQNALVYMQQANLADNPLAKHFIDVITDHIRLIGKLYRKLQFSQPARFLTLPFSGELVLYYWSQIEAATNGRPEDIYDSNQALFPVRFLVQGMVLFRENLAQWSPKESSSPKVEILSQEFVNRAVTLLITRFMPLNKLDLDNWMADPEDWVNGEDNDNKQWEFEIRPCSERVLMTLSHRYKEYVTPLLIETFRQFATQPCPDIDSVIRKEAVYCAIGRCANRLKNDISFDEWLQKTLATEAQSTNPTYAIIKRRIAWLIGKWIGDECSSPNNPQMWDILVHLLRDRGPGTDGVVRLTAAAAVKDCVDTITFDPVVFSPYLPTVVAELMGLIGEAETFESKSRVARSLNTVIERVGLSIVPFISIITKPIPELWTAAEDNWIFKSSMLNTMAKLAQSTREHSFLLSPIVIPLIRESFSPNVISHLDEDGLGLWQTALRYTSTIHSDNGAPCLFDVFPLAVTLLKTNLDLLGKITGILESYLIIAGSSVLEAYATQIFDAFRTALSSDAVVINMKDMIVCLNFLIQTTPSTLWGEALHVSGLFLRLVETLIEDKNGKTLLLVEHICLLSRIAIADRQMFLQLMAAAPTAPGRSPTNSPVTESFLWEGLLDQWWSKFDNMSEPRFRKLSAMGITSLVATGRPEVLNRLPGEIFNLWLDVFGEIKEARLSAETNVDDSSTDPSTTLRRHWELDEAPYQYYANTEGTPEYNRRKAIYNRDPIRTTQLTKYVASCLQQAEAVCGGPQILQEQYLAKADPAVVQQIQAELQNSA